MGKNGPKEWDLGPFTNKAGGGERKDSKGSGLPFTDELIMALLCTNKAA